MGISGSLYAQRSLEAADLNNDGAADFVRSSPLAGPITTYSTVFDRPPSVQPVELSTNLVTSIPFGITAADPDGDALSWAVSTPPAAGKVSATQPPFTYTPGNFAGTETFVLRAYDGHGQWSDLPVTVHVQGLSYHAMTPRRVLDTRLGLGGPTAPSPPRLGGRIAVASDLEPERPPRRDGGEPRDRAP